MKVFVGGAKKEIRERIIEIARLIHPRPVSVEVTSGRVEEVIGRVRGQRYLERIFSLLDRSNIVCYNYCGGEDKCWQKEPLRIRSPFQKRLSINLAM